MRKLRSAGWESSATIASISCCDGAAEEALMIVLAEYLYDVRLA